MTPVRALSVVVPAYNAAGTIVESITSVTNAADQLDALDLEVVVVDDGSTDGTASVVVAAFADDERVRVHRHRRNRGGAAARNTAVDAARHEWLFCLDSDNLVDAASLQRIVAMASTGEWDIVAPAETRYFRVAPSVPVHSWFWDRERVELRDVLSVYETPVASGNYLFTLDTWARAGGYPEFAGSLDAWGFGLRALFTGARFGVCREAFYYHRQGHDSYYMRDTDDRRSVAAAQILLPFVSRLAPEDRARLMGEGALLRYYVQLQEAPLRLDDDTVPEFGGRIVVTLPDGNTRVLRNNGQHDGAPGRARAAARRAWESSPQATMRRLRRAFGLAPQPNRAPDA
jgi:glycosyltransferase involved in cell wall biosynthesis